MNWPDDPLRLYPEVPPPSTSEGFSAGLPAAFFWRFGWPSKRGNPKPLGPVVQPGNEDPAYVADCVLAVLVGPNFFVWLLWATRHLSL